MSMRTRARCCVLALTTLLGCSDHHDTDAAAAGKDPFGNASSGDRAGAGSNASGANGSAGSGTGVHDANGNAVATILPYFPGAGTSDAGDPLPNGMVCDSVSGEPSPIPERIEQCYYDKNDPNPSGPAATLEQVLECVEEADTVHIRLTFHPWFVDNTYGLNAVGWDAQDATAPAPMMAPMMMAGMVAPKMPKMMKGGHTFKDLVGSDHAEFILKDANDQVVMQFKLDYISIDANAPSGYASLGVLGGEGKVAIGDPAWVVRWMTSEDRNLNERGYASYTTDSPATDGDYTPNAETPEWDYRVVYEAWVDIRAFGAAGFGGASIEYVHASPAKTSSNTIEVKPGKCPPCNDPDGCHDNPPPPPPTCGSNDPDEVCADAGGIPNGGKPVPNCEENPQECMVD
jgi:hypothetical protein